MWLHPKVCTATPVRVSPRADEGTNRCHESRNVELTPISSSENKFSPNKFQDGRSIISIISRSRRSFLRSPQDAFRRRCPTSQQLRPSHNWRQYECKGRYGNLLPVPMASSLICHCLHKRCPCTMTIAVLRTQN